MIIIAFGHRKYVGKDTMCRMLKKEINRRRPGLNVRICGFADKVKEVTYDIFGWTGVMPGDFYEEKGNAYLKNRVLPIIGKSPRQLWIGVGNGVRIATGQDQVWADYLMQGLTCDVLLIKDLRFLGEANILMEHHASIYRIDRHDLPKETDGADEPLENFQGWTGVIEAIKDDYQPFTKAVNEIMETLRL